MKALKQKASSLLQRSSSTQDKSTASNQPFAFLTDGAKEDLNERKLLIHQEAVAGLIQSYAASVVKAFNDLAMVHEALHGGLAQAGDLADEAWTRRVGALMQEFKNRTEEAQQRLTEANSCISECREEHRAATKKAVDSERAERKRKHYDQKVEKLRVDAAEARAGLGSNAVDATAKDAGGKSNKMKTMQADVKIGKLVRNEEKLKQISEKAQSLHEEADRSLGHCLTACRRRLRTAIDDIVRCSLEELLPTIQTSLFNAAQRVASPPKADQGRQTQTGGYADGASPEKVATRRPSALHCFAVGESVVITGLNSAAQYNGFDGEVRNIRDDGRVEVEVKEACRQDGNQQQSPNSKILALKPENLIRATSVSAASTEFLGTGLELVGFDPDLWPKGGASSDDSSDA